MKKAIFFALALTGCSNVASLEPIVAPAVKAVVGATPLSDIAAAGCAAQAAINAANAIATAQGNTAWAQQFSTASTVAGLACAW